MDTSNRLFCFVVLQIKGLTAARDLDKQSLLHLLSFMEDTLNKHWADHESFIALQERILALRMILEESGEGNNLG